MTPSASDVDHRLAALRRAFDDAFALPLNEPEHDRIELLLIVAGGHPYAMRIAELAGLEVDRTVVPVPMDAPALLGLCAVRGQLAPVFALAAVLGREPARAPARWIALHRDKELIGLAFDEFQGSRRVAVQDVSPLQLAPEDTHLGPSTPSTGSRSMVSRTLSREAIRVDGRVIHVVDIPSVVSRLRQMMSRR